MEDCKELADLLTKGRFAAQTIVVIDSCFTQAVFGQHVEKQDQRRIHHMQTLHIDNEKLADEAESDIWGMYEASKPTLWDIYGNPNESLDMAKTLADTWIGYFPKVVQTKTGVEALTW